MNVSGLSIRTIQQVDLPPEMAQVDKVSRVMKNKLAIIGRVSSSFWEIAVICLSSGKLCDSFDALLPFISPDGRYLAFIKPYPLHFVRGVEDHFMIYDFSKSASENRPRQAPGSTNVGAAIFPIDVGNEDADNINVDNPYRSASPDILFWSPDSKKLAFAIMVNGDTSLVLATFHSDESASIGTVRIQREGLCSSGSKHGCTVLLRNLAFTKAGVSALFVSAEPGSQRARTFAFSSAQFS